MVSCVCLCILIKNEILRYKTSKNINIILFYFQKCLHFNIIQSRFLVEHEHVGLMKVLLEHPKIVLNFVQLQQRWPSSKETVLDQFCIGSRDKQISKGRK